MTSFRLRRSASSLSLCLLLAGTAFLIPASAQQQPSCSVNAATPAVHAEGLTERVGDLTLSCSGGTVGATASLTLFVALNTNITNRLDGNGVPLGVTVAGATAGSVRLTSATTLNVSALNYTVTAGTSVITLGGLRAAVATLTNGPVTAQIVGVGASFPAGLSLSVSGVPAPTLLASVINNGVPCNGSPLPSTLDFSGFAGASASSTVRVTEATATAFTAADAGADSGLRIRVNLTGYGAGARVFAPDAIVGNSGTTPTSGGAFSSTPGAGTYTPGASQLLLIRVNGATAAGAGGTLALAPPAAATSFSTVSEVALTNGAAVLVYEVADSSAALTEAAQIPVFVTVNATSCPGTLAPQVAVSVAPVSAVATATASTGDAIPRFVASVPGLDCQQTGDCTASYYPKLVVDQTSLTLAGSSKGGPQSAFVRVMNMGSGILDFTTSVNYTSGSGWLTITPPTGSNNVTAQVIADPTLLAPGTYTATVTVNAGLYGSAAIPVTFNVGPVGVVILNVGNAASYTYGTVAPGSYAALFGLNMAGTNVGVTFNGLPATIVYQSATQINLVVPAALGTQQAASVVVTADGLASAPFRVTLAVNSPGMFTPGIVNFTGGATNDAGHPAARGAFVTAYLTGLAIPLTGQVTVNIGGQMNLIPSFAGAQPTLPALDQVNIVVPASLPAGVSPVPFQVCIPGSLGQQVCSNAVNLYVQ